MIRSSIAFKLARVHQEQHIKHLEYLKDEIELTEFKEEPIDEDVIDALSLIQDQIQPKKDEKTCENLDDGSDGGYGSTSMTDSIKSETSSDLTPYNSSDDSLDWPSEVKRKVDIYVKPIDDSLSMVNMDGRSIESAQPHFVDFLPLAFTAIVWNNVLNSLKIHSVK